MTQSNLLKTLLAAAAIGGAGVAFAQTSTMPADSTGSGVAPSSQYQSGGSAAGGTRDPYTSGARTGDRFDPYTQGANQPTQQYLAPTGADSMSMSGRYDGRMENHDTHYHDLSTLGSRTGMRSQFLDGGN
ncbi:hypothetical protein L602_004000000230 [Cupriavidus gilardii J11]|uniref:Endonuclease n=1 Tax=Cupriavidus gilardii J11 TaxID=936133 RepID=A0A562B8G2_9BURK|nr:hypothetical protein [Cupriavidus gilardii]TWG81485.1 hypothetical protein L602_004000000230 [Cupriavidus gilardii J11]